MTSLEECWNQVIRAFGVRPQQSFTELELFYPYVAQLKPRRILEIGVECGGSLRFWINAASDDALIIGIDNDPEIPSRVKIWSDWIRTGQELVIINKDSRLPETLDAVKKVLKGEKLDFLFIDGNHEMPSPRIDYEFYAPLVREGGIIAFHDIGGPPECNCPSLRDFWYDLKQEIVRTTFWKTIEFFARHPISGCSGIGVIIKEKPNINNLLKADTYVTVSYTHLTLPTKA